MRISEDLRKSAPNGNLMERCIIARRGDRQVARLSDQPDGGRPEARVTCLQNSGHGFRGHGTPCPCFSRGPGDVHWGSGALKVKGRLRSAQGARHRSGWGRPYRAPNEGGPHGPRAPAACAASALGSSESPLRGSCPVHLVRFSISGAELPGGCAAPVPCIDGATTFQAGFGLGLRCGSPESLKGLRPGLI